MQITTEVTELGKGDFIRNGKLHFIGLTALNFDGSGLRSELKSFGNLDTRDTSGHGNFYIAGGVEESAKITVGTFVLAIAPGPFLRPLACEGKLGQIISCRLVKISIRPN